MNKAYFKDIRNQIIPYLENAKSKVQIAMAWFTSGELFEALLSCRRRNVNVELVLLDSGINYMYYAPDFNNLIAAGGTLRIAGSNVGFMHHKFCIVDGKVAITGSYNWTYYAETRNIENIVITDDMDIVNLYASEFNRLCRLVSVSSSCLRLSWDDLETRDDVDFRELNYEIQRICEVQQKPIRRIYTAKAEVIRTEISLTPFAKYDIGILFRPDGAERDELKTFIPYGTKLPYHSTSGFLYFDSKNEKEFKCWFVYDNPNAEHDGGLVEMVDLIDMAKGTCNENLELSFSMQLDDNGCLRIDILCKESNQKRTFSRLMSNLVKYELRCTEFG